MTWSNEEIEIIEKYRNLIETDPQKAIGKIIENYNGLNWAKGGKIILSLLLVLKAKIYLEPADLDIEVQYSLDDGHSINVLMYVELNGDEGIDDKGVCLGEFGHELESFYGFDKATSEGIKSLVV